MNKTKYKETERKILVDINELRGMLSIGRGSALKIGESAGAVVQIGRRKLYNVKKIEAYMDAITRG